MFVVRLVLLLFSFNVVAESISHDPRWLKLYQYKKHFGQYVSDISSERFFFSNEGRNSPEKEFQAAIQAFSADGKDQKKYGTLSLPAACAYPARKQILESLLGRMFPSPLCPEVKDWLDRLSADRVSMVFVGAYAGNAASIMGHTFLRLTNSKREDSHREGIDLLSYVVGYTAHTPATDGRVSYIVKGLTGAYPGFYDIEPYYMKVGLYNNAESRDLWELRLKLTPEEVSLLAKIIWEYTFNAQINYYFMGKNCSYRLLTLLEAAKPDLDVAKEFNGVVIPAETVRALIDKGMSSMDLEYRASIQRRLKEKINQLSERSHADFKLAIKSKQKLNEINDPNLLDALMDYWLYENFKVQTHLPENEKEQMESTIRKAAELKEISTLKISNEEIRVKNQLSPPYLGHRPRSLEFFGGGFNTGDGHFLGLNTRLGLHPVWLFDPSYQEISALEYLGFDVKSQSFSGNESFLWNALLIRVQTLEDVMEWKPSWGFHIGLGNDCLVCTDEKANLNISGSFGISQKFYDWRIAVLPQLYGTTGEQDPQISPGVSGMIRWGRGRWSIYLERSFHFTRKANLDLLDTRLSYQLSPNLYASLRAQNKSDTNPYSLNGVYFF